LTAQLLVVDEAAFVDRRLFTEGLFPILRMKDTALLCLSSPGDESNHYSRMVQAVDSATQKPVFKYIQAKQICDECLKLPNEEAVKCEHIKNTSPWINHRRSKKFQALYDDPVLAMAEYGGVIRSSNMSAFRKSEILTLFDENQTPRVRTTATPSMIFITADNNGGGSSHMALCSGYYAVDGTFVVSFFSSLLKKFTHVYFFFVFVFVFCFLFRSVPDHFLRIEDSDCVVVVLFVGMRYAFIATAMVSLTTELIFVSSTIVP